jgi:hypothetical protein
MLLVNEDGTPCRFIEQFLNFKCDDQAYEWQKREIPEKQAVLKLLALSDEPDAKVVRAWIMRNAPYHDIAWDRDFWVDDYPADYVNGTIIVGAYCPVTFAWEIRLLELATHWVLFRNLQTWERSGARTRRELSERIARVALALAELMEDSRGEPIASVGNFIDEEIAIKYLTGVWEAAQTQNDPEARMNGPLDDFVYKVGPARRFTELTGLHKQTWGALLRRLSRNAVAFSNSQARDSRPTTGAADARVFARSLANDYFKPKFDRNPNGVIAACVRLRYPDLGSPPDESTIRDWRGVK